MTTEPKERLLLEVQTLRHVLALPVEERAAAAEKYSKATVDLVGLWRAVSITMQTHPGLVLADLGAILERPDLKSEASKLQACPEALEILNGKGMDPAALKQAAGAMLADTERRGDLRRVQDAQELLDRARHTENARDRRELLAAAAATIERAEHAAAVSLADTWGARVQAMRGGDEAGANEVLKLDPRRGAWADWMNARLGLRGGLEAGKMFILGGAWGAGKTSLAALFAVDALAARCPVLFWQLELGVEETLEHMVAQDLDAKEPFIEHWKTKFWNRAHKALPKAWQELLTIPRWPAYEVEDITAALGAHARKATLANEHKVKGLVIVDYVQQVRLADGNARMPQHEVLTTAANRLAKAAAETGASVLLLSQFNKTDINQGSLEGTALAGADLARMGDRVALLHKANAAGKPCGAGDEVDTREDKGEARLLTWVKDRGVRWADIEPAKSRVIWYARQSRALHGGDEPRPATQDKINF